MNDKLRKFSPSVRQVSTTILGDKSMLHLGPVALCATSLYIEITEYILKGLIDTINLIKTFQGFVRMVGDTFSAIKSIINR